MSRCGRVSPCGFVFVVVDILRFISYTCLHISITNFFSDCWLVAAFACASEFPDMIRHMFLTKEYNPRGLYKIRIYDPQNEKWCIVVVDDRIPCPKGTKRPMFMKPNGAELWAILLEKAYAKFCGSYSKIDGTFSFFSIQCNMCFGFFRFFLCYVTFVVVSHNTTHLWFHPFYLF